MNRMKKFVDNYELKEKNHLIKNKMRARQNIANAKCEYDRIKADLSSGQGLAGDTMQRLQNREQELAAMVRRSLITNNLSSRYI